MPVSSKAYKRGDLLRQHVQWLAKQIGKLACVPQSPELPQGCVSESGRMKYREKIVAKI